MIEDTGEYNLDWLLLFLLFYTKPSAKSAREHFRFAVWTFWTLLQGSLLEVAIYALVTCEQEPKACFWDMLKRLSPSMVFCLRLDSLKIIPASNYLINPLFLGNMAPGGTIAMVTLWNPLHIFTTIYRGQHKPIPEGPEN